MQFFFHISTSVSFSLDAYRQDKIQEQDVHTLMGVRSMLMVNYRQFKSSKFVLNYVNTQTIRSGQPSLIRESDSAFKMVNIDFSISVSIFPFPIKWQSVTTASPPFVNVPVADVAFKWGGINLSNNVTAQSSSLDMELYPALWGSLSDDNRNATLPHERCCSQNALWMYRLPHFFMFTLILTSLISDQATSLVCVCVLMQIVLKPICILHT